MHSYNILQKHLKKKFYINNKNAYNSTTKAFLYLFILENTFDSCKSIVTGRVLIHTGWNAFQQMYCANMPH